MFSLWLKILIEHGSDEVILVEDDKLEEYLVLPFSSIFEQVIKVRNLKLRFLLLLPPGVN